MGAELPSLAKTLSQEKIDRYARASGDFNPIHVDPAFAAQTPFGGTIAHGMLLLAYLSEMLTAAFGQAWLSGGRLKVRFKGAARSGETVAIGGHVQRTRVQPKFHFHIAADQDEVAACVPLKHIGAGTIDCERLHLHKAWRTKADCAAA